MEHSQLQSKVPLESKTHFGGANESELAADLASCQQLLHEAQLARELLLSEQVCFFLVIYS